MTDQVNALGQPSPNRTDFTSWSRKGLEEFARQAADENLVLRADNKALLEQWRVQVREIEDLRSRKDGAYLERNRLVSLLSKIFPSGTRKTAIDGWSEDWHGCVYIDLPTGQASWHYHDSQAWLFDHLGPYAGGYDGHTTDEKYARIEKIGAGHA